MPTNADSVALIFSDVRLDATNRLSVYTDPDSGLLVTQEVFDTTGVILEWLSFTNTAYRYEVWESADLSAGFSARETNLPPTPPVNVFTNPFSPGGPHLYQLRVRRE